MFNLSELEQFVAFAELGTLSRAAEQLHISQPTMTRSMQHVEDDFGAALFNRNKNKISLNSTGQKAVEYARILLADTHRAISAIREYDKSLHTIKLISCAPFPLWTVLPIVSDKFPDMTISSEIKNNDILDDALNAAVYDLYIFSHEVYMDGYTCIPFQKESLLLCVTPAHKLANRESLTFADINGFNLLLRSEIGFWDDLCRIKMPASRFLIQTDDFEFNELLKESSLPCFTTDVVMETTPVPSGRQVIPITDTEATATYYLVFKTGESMFQHLISLLLSIDHANQFVHAHPKNG